MSYRDIFEQRGHLYNEAHNIAPCARDAEAANLIKWLQPVAGETIVVTAAGGGYDTGRIAQYLAPESAQLICVEPSERFSSLIPKTYQVLNAPLHEIPLPDGCADSVINLAALHHCENRDELFSQWDRLLKPGGRIVIADVEAGSPNGEFLNRVVDEFTPGGHKGVFLHPGELSEAFGKKAYIRIEEELESFVWNFRSHDEMVQFTRSLFGMVHANDEQIVAGVEQYLGVGDGADDAPISYPWSLRFFRAYKP